ncbi:MAG: hypothetical protein K9G12_06105 [Candidatus Nanopelagicales bacterium]|nr:hypothetical protein [Candidatus Nanopelagicales bacterium]MCF8539836.1 hypothetical protein [Candidatus Nanopelagicales bacterium]
MSPDVTTTHLTLRERVGGRWAVSWIGYLLWYPLSIVFVFATVPAFQSADQIVSGIVVSTLAYLAAGVVMWVASITVLRNRRTTPAPVVVVAGVGGLSWAVRSLIIGVSIDTLGLPASTNLLSRFAYGFVLGAIIDTTSAFALDSVDRFRTAREQLVQERVAELIATSQEEAATQALRLGLLAQVQGAMRSARVDLDSLDLSSDSVPPQAVAALERVSEQGIRQVAHDTWVQSERIGHIRPTELMATAADRGFYRWWFPLVGTVFLLIPLARFLDLTTVSIMVLVGAYVWAVAMAANRLMRVFVHWRPLILIVSVLLLATAGLVAYLLTTWHVIQGGFPTPALALISLTAGVVFPLVSVAYAWQPASEEALDRLRSALRESDIARVDAAERERRVRQEIAVMLHGSLGAQFTAATMRMRHAIARGDTASAREALQEARRLTDVDLTTWTPIEEHDVHTAVERVIDPWLGIVDIDVTIFPDIECSRSDTEKIIDVVTEGITNAVRHGQATRIDIAVTPTPAGFDITVTSDGSGDAGDRPGLGSRLFDQVAAQQWELVPRQHSAGMELRVSLVKEG